MNNTTNNNMAGDFDRTTIFMNEIEQENLERSTGCDIFSSFTGSMGQIYGSDYADLR